MLYSARITSIVQETRLTAPNLAVKALPLVVDIYGHGDTLLCNVISQELSNLDHEDNIPRVLSTLLEQCRRDGL